MKLIVGLGNPGEKYKNTRHNIGFMVLDELLKMLNIDKWKLEKNAEKAECICKKEKIVFIKPQKYINLSGEVIKEYINYYKIKPIDILVIHDDMDLEVGRIKLVQSGSSAGHNGLKNIEENLQTKEYKRIKVGIGKNKLKDVINHVLGKINKKEEEKIVSSINLAVEIVLEYFENDFVYLMNKYNKKERKDE